MNGLETWTTTAGFDVKVNPRKPNIEEAERLGWVKVEEESLEQPDSGDETQPDGEREPE